ncbi:sugar transporter [Thalassiosira pseudonana CCMP1335]|uniref:Hexose transporter 1 n=1 Tax=Thalassiosira pseudonana TaxID=35128 RepID=B8BXU0_THAPS|nr:sugar transporter [Thalassiosira pseudonana CCMP1335]EED94266.1 sugar transporter [Thalassiosira pseudonana CCMP1335]
MSLLLLDELEVDSTVVTTPLIFAVLIASMLMFNMGYNISVMNAPEPFVFPGHSTSAWSMAVAAFCVGGPFGSVLAGQWADQRGRRGALLLTTWLFIFGGLVQSMAPSLSVVILARMLIGVASGASTVLVPVYLGELAPPNLRGVIGTLTQFALVIGIFFADLVGFLFANANQWRYMFALTTVMALLQLALTPFLLESPRWLLGRNANSSKARFIIKKLRGFSSYDGDWEDKENPNQPNNKSSQNAMTEMFADKTIRLLVVSTLVLQVANQLSGINAVFFYSGLFFEGVIDNPLVGTTLIGGINVIATYVALLLMDRCGRRTLIMWSSAGMFVSCVIIVLSLKGYLDKLVALGAVASYVSFFEIGLGPIPWLVVAEMFEGKYVTSAMSISSQLNWTCNFFVGLLFPYINKALGPYSFVPFATVLLLTFVYAWIWLPETQGTTPEELQAKLIKKNVNTTYHNMDIEGTVSGGPPSQDEWAEALASMQSYEDNAGEESVVKSQM